ncbi:MAG: carbohydrate ABC transporter permease [Chloroflexi bacterium]|nr:carbohydrate ABC transporter permease [Chloroflexota bacterium]
MIDAPTNERPVWAEKPSRTLALAKFIVLLITVVLVMYPLITVLSTSLSSEADVQAAGGLVLFPHHPNLNAYRNILTRGIIEHAVLVSVFITLAGTAASLVVSVMMAYGISRPIVGRRLIIILLLFSFLFPGGLIPTYLVVRSLHLLNNYMSLILPTLTNAFSVIILQQFFMHGVPEELVDSARIDGASDWTILARVTLPLSKGVIAVVALLSAVAHWNAYIPALLYLNDSRMWPLSMILRLYASAGQGSPGQDIPPELVAPPQSIVTAVIILATVPILFVYPWLQKYFTRGVLSGALRG